MPLPDFQMLANRLQKMNRHIGKWARRQGITCYRVYDADVPEFPLAIDWYEGRLHVAEYERDHPLDEEEYLTWRSGCRQIMAETLEVAPELIWFKSRSRQKGTAQYEKFADRGQEFFVHEDGLQFKVNLSDYLDTGPLPRPPADPQIGAPVSQGQKRAQPLCLHRRLHRVCRSRRSIGHHYARHVGHLPSMGRGKSENQSFKRHATPVYPNRRHRLATQRTHRKIRHHRARSPHFFQLQTDATRFRHPKRPHLPHQSLPATPQPRRHPLFLYQFPKVSNWIPSESGEAPASPTSAPKTVPEDFRNKKIHHCFQIDV
jgi:hypothetical protein